MNHKPKMCTRWLENKLKELKHNLFLVFYDAKNELNMLRLIIKTNEHVFMMYELTQGLIPKIR